MTLHGNCCCGGTPTPQPRYRFDRCPCDQFSPHPHIELPCQIINDLFFGGGDIVSSPHDLTLLVHQQGFNAFCYHLPAGSQCIDGPSAAPGATILAALDDCEECCGANQCAYLMTACTPEQPQQFWLRRCANAGSEPGNVVRTPSNGCYTMGSTPLPLPLPPHPFYEGGLDIIANCSECEQPVECIQSVIGQQYGTALACNIPAGQVYFDYCLPPDVPEGQRWCGRLHSPGDSFAVFLGSGGGLTICGQCSGGAGYTNFNSTPHTPTSCCGSAPVFTARYTAAFSCCANLNGWLGVVQYIYGLGITNSVIFRQCYFKPGQPPVGTYSAIGAPAFDGSFFPRGAPCCVNPFDCSPQPQCCNCPPPQVPQTITLS